MLLGLGMIVLVLGAKLGLIHAFGTDQPFADQWAAEGTAFVQAPLHADLNPASFFWPHGEHRPAITRLITWALIVGNGGQWDCYVEIVFNLTITAVLLLVAWRIVLRVARGWMLPIAALLMAVLFSAPCAYENLLWGFQSQFVFLLFTGLLHVFGTLRTGRLDGVWCGAQLAGWCGLFSIAAGLVSPAVLAAVATWEILRGRRNAWAWCTLGVNAAVLAYGLWLLPVNLAGGDHTLGELPAAFGRTIHLLAWPMQPGWWALLFYAPCLGALGLWLFAPKDRGRDRLAAVLGLWVAGILFSIAYGRTISAATIGVRYFDVMFMGVFVNGVALLGIIGPRPIRAVWGWRTLAVVWLAGAGVAFWSVNHPARAGAMLREQKRLALEQREVVAQFISSGDVAILEEYDRRTHRFPHFQLTVDLLRDPKVTPHLPPGLAGDGAAIGPLSRIAPIITSSWKLWLGAGLALWAAGLWAGRRERREAGAQ